MRLSINTFNFIGDIIGAVFTGTMLFWMFSDLTAPIYYMFGIVMLITNIIGLVKTKKANGKAVGNILGTIAAALHSFTGFLAIPALVLYILASIFTFKSKVVIE